MILIYNQCTGWTILINLHANMKQLLFETFFEKTFFRDIHVY